MKLNVLSKATLSPDLLVRRMVNAHRKHAPEIEMQMAIWLNASSEMFYPWQRGIDLLEIGRGVSADTEPEFHATEFGPHNDWPRLRLTLAHPVEFQTTLGAKYLRRLIRRLQSGKAKIVFSKAKLANSSLRELLAAGRPSR